MWTGSRNMPTVYFLAAFHTLPNPPPYPTPYLYLTTLFFPTQPHRAEQKTTPRHALHPSLSHHATTCRATPRYRPMILPLGFAQQGTRKEHSIYFSNHYKAYTLDEGHWSCEYSIYILTSDRGCVCVCHTLLW